MFKLTKLRLKKLFSRKPSKQLNKAVNKKGTSDHKGQIAELQTERHAIKHVKQSIKSNKATIKIDKILR